AAVAEAIEIADRSDQGWWLPEIHRLDGELLMMQTQPELGRAEACFEKALGLAWRRGERGLALRAALSLAQLRHQTDALDPARPLREVCETFTEGFDTADLQAASLVLSMGT
ncbi:MAG: adenylate cyclase, partial [Acidobacteriota bacterium]